MIGNTRKIIYKVWFILFTEGLPFLIKKVTNKIFKRKVINVIEPNQEQISSSLEEHKPLKLQTSENPLVSIIIPIYNKYLYTFNCLKSLQNINLINDVEIIIVDDASIDESEKLLKEISGIKVLRNLENLGFIRSCNKGISQSQGKFICLLNNDTQVEQDWLEQLLKLIQEDETVGAVGSKLVYPDRRLQEAGGIIWKDGSGWNYGRFDSPIEPEYNYVRNVDYCSAASLLIRTELIQNLGGLSEEFVPAYYEDTDLCFSIRHLGYKILYQPKSKLIHYEGISSGTNIKSGIKKYQDINREKFIFKWKNILAEHLFPSELNVDSGARRIDGVKTILIVDSYVPIYDRESGSCRIFEIIKILKSLDYAIIFLPDNGNPEEPYTSALQQLGVEVLYCTNQQPNILNQLKKRLRLIDIAWVCRPELCQKYLNTIKKKSKIKVIYDTIDLHFIRLKRQWEITSKKKNKLQEQAWKDYQSLETSLAKSVDVTIVVTEIEKNVLNNFGINKVCTIPNIHQSDSKRVTKFDRSKDLLFIGGYNHTPNVDAVIWLCQKIMPIIWNTEPNIKLTLLGSNPPHQVKDLENNQVTVTGYIKNVEPYFLNSRVFVAPLRFGAGMKGKIGQSLSYGLPVVTTNIGAEGIGLIHNFDVMIADESELFAKHILELYNNFSHWTYLANNGLKTIGRYSPKSIKSQLVNLFEYL